MKNKVHLTPRMLLMFAVLLCIALLTSCSRGCNPPPTGGGSGSATASPSPTPSPVIGDNKSEDEITVEDDKAEEDNSKTLAGLPRSSVREMLSFVFLNGSPRPLRSGASRWLKSGDRIKTDQRGTAEVNIADCMTVYVYQASGFSLAACPGFAGGSAVCWGAGTGVFNNKCRSHIRKIETDTAEISLGGTYLRVAYWPEKKRTIIDVHEGPVLVRQLLAPNSRRLGEPVEIKEGCWCAPSDQCFIPGVPSGGPRPCTDLTDENKAYLEPTNDETVKQALVDKKPIAPEPDLRDTQNPHVTVSRLEPLKFGERPVGIQTVKDLSIRNMSSLPLKFDKVLVNDSTRNFHLLSENCSVHQVASGDTCSISVVFKPLTTGDHDGFLDIADNAKGSPRVVSLTGTAVTTAVWPTSIAPEALDFGKQRLGVTSKARKLVVINSDSPTVGFGETVIEGVTKDDFKVSSNDCKSGVSLCTVEVVFTPRALGERTATLVIPGQSVRPGVPQQKKTVALRGLGTLDDVTTDPDPSNPLRPRPAPKLALDGDRVCFTGYKVVDPHAVLIRKTETITIENKGNAPLIIDRVIPSSDDFVIQSQTCVGQKLTDKCEVTVGFTPRDTRTRTGVLTISSNDPKAPTKQVPLTGRGKHRNWFVRGVQWLFRINQEDPCKP